MGAGRPSKRRRVESTDIKSESEPKSSLFFTIPLELRLQIYDHALSDVTITVSEQERNTFEPDGAEDGKGDIPGLPSKYVPFVKNEYDPGMVMVGKPIVRPYQSLLDQAVIAPPMDINSLAAVSMDSGYASAGSSMYSIATASTTSLLFPTAEANKSLIPPITNASLLQVNKQIRDEMLSHLKSRTCKQTTLYTTYPHGLLVLRHHYRDLLRYSKHVVVTGQYAGSISSHLLPRAQVDSPTSTASSPQLAASKALSSLTRTLYKSYRQVLPEEYYATMPTLHMRIHYPDERCYSAIWGDDASPIVTAMQFIPSGYIECKTWRARTGNGVTMKVRPPKDEKDCHDWHRNLSSVFRRIRPQRYNRHMRQDRRRTEEFWDYAFGDEKIFEALVPEETCWTKM